MDWAVTVHLLTIFILAVLLLITATPIDMKLEIMKSKNATYCGSSLADALSIVCKGKYNTPHLHDRQKRAKENVPLQRLKNNSYHSPFNSKIRKKFMSLKRIRRKRFSNDGVPKGVYNECCQNPCSYVVLRTYCAD